MNTLHEAEGPEGPEGPEGWTDSEYKSFKAGEDTSDSESDVDEPLIIRGYKKEKYKKILFTEELLPE
jgi:hypothetical protein